MTDKQLRMDIKMEGVKAFRDGAPDSTCPYRGHGADATEMSEKRVWWMTGYWAAHVVQHVQCCTLSEQLR